MKWIPMKMIFSENPSELCLAVAENFVVRGPTSAGSSGKILGSSRKSKQIFVTKYRTPSMITFPLGLLKFRN